MVKRIHVGMLVGVGLMLGFSGQAMAQSSDRETEFQQASPHQKLLIKNNKSSEQQAADKASDRNVEETVGGEERGDYVMAAQMPSQVLASSLIGMTIRNKAEQIGSVRDLVLNKKYELVGFVVDMSGATGLISKSVGISWGAVKHIDLKKGVIQVSVKKPKLQSVRSYTTQQELQK